MDARFAMNALFKEDPIRSNTILYCRCFSECVTFYKEVIGLRIHLSTAWLVEFQLSEAAYLSIADAHRTTIDSTGGVGITLSFAVLDIDAAHNDLSRKGIPVSAFKSIWNARVFYLQDPEGHRIELWQGDPAAN